MCVLKKEVQLLVLPQCVDNGEIRRIDHRKETEPKQVPHGV